MKNEDENLVSSPETNFRLISGAYLTGLYVFDSFIIHQTVFVWTL